MSHQSIEIICPSCGKETLLRRAPKYNGFTRIGEELSCGSCGHVFANEADVPFKKKKKVSVFTNDDQTTPVHIFSQDENKQLCRYCAHYIVNPFIQRCAHLKKEVEATDTCEHFIPKKQYDMTEYKIAQSKPKSEKDVARPDPACSGASPEFTPPKAGEREQRASQSDMKQWFKGKSG